MIANDNIDKRDSICDNENYKRKVDMHALYIPNIFFNDFK
jgi:hypothetical protein